RPPGPAASRSTNGWRFGRFWPTRPRSPSERAAAAGPRTRGDRCPRAARGDFASAEDAVQDALVEAVRVWPDDPPHDPKGWLVTVAWRKFLDAARADTSRRRREVRIEGEPMPGPD